MLTGKRFIETGFTLVELMVTVAVISILASVAVPAYQNMIETRRVVAATEGIYAQMQFARSEAIKLNQDLYVSVRTSTPWCLGITDNASGCDCSSANACTYGPLGSVVQRVLTGSDYPNSSITSTMSTAHIDGTRGFFIGSWGSIEVDGGKGKIVFSQLGRIRICTESRIGGYPSC